MKCSKNHANNKNLSGFFVGQYIFPKITYCIRPSFQSAVWVTHRGRNINMFTYSLLLHMLTSFFSFCSFQVKTRRCGRSLCSACPCWSSCTEEMVMTVCHRRVCGALNTCCAHRCKPNPSESNAQHLGSSSDWWVVHTWCADTLITETSLKYFCVILEPWPLLFLYFPTWKKIFEKNNNTCNHHCWMKYYWDRLCADTRTRRGSPAEPLLSK